MCHLLSRHGAEILQETDLVEHLQYCNAQFFTETVCISLFPICHLIIVVVVRYLDFAFENDNYSSDYIICCKSTKNRS